MSRAGTIFSPHIRGVWIRVLTEIAIGALLVALFADRLIAALLLRVLPHASFKSA